jgi:tRNA-binding EMAP/Myf-like protein
MNQDTDRSRANLSAFQQLVDLRVARVTHISVALTRKPSRVFSLDLGPLGILTAVGQFVLVPEEELINRHVIVCCNLGEKPMGPHVSQVLVLGTPHPNSPRDQQQALPLFADQRSIPGERVF